MMKEAPGRVKKGGGGEVKVWNGGTALTASGWRSRSVKLG